jgi:hypothetical protein
MSWVKMPFWSFVAKETMRPGFLPFALGGAFSFLTCGVYIQSKITDDMRKESKYYKQFVLGQK